MVSGGGTLQRGKSENGHHRVTFVELFFDLVFVFAITQLSHCLLAYLSIQRCSFGRMGRIAKVFHTR
jgi:low temperature requirement protein LtrA